MVLPLVVAVRIFVNPLSNVFQKLLTRRAADPLFIICVTHAVLALVCMPIAVVHRPPVVMIAGAVLIIMAR